MPSYAYKNYKKRVIDVQRLVLDYETLLSLKGHKGRPALDHLTRSGVVLLNGAWECYIEDVLLEVCVHLVTIGDLDKLPKNVKKTISTFIKNHKEDNKSLSLAGDGWKRLFLHEIASPTTESFNTPKLNNIDEIGKKLIGIDRLSNCLDDRSKDFIEEFVTYRGHIAHRVRVKGDEYLNAQQLSDYLWSFHSIIQKIDNHLSEYLKKYNKVRPWNKTNAV